MGENCFSEIVNVVCKILNQFRDTVALSLVELGCTDSVTMDIKENSDGKPIFGRPYRVSETERAEIGKIDTSYKKIGAVRQTNSPNASPVFIV